MILFCEDCGEKNRVDPSVLTGDRVRFTCRECGYVNSYCVQGPETKIREQTDRILDAMLSSPGVIGAFFYRVHGGIVFSRMPPVLKQADIDVLGRTFCRSYVHALCFFPDINAMRTRIADKYFSVRRIRTGLFLAIVSRTPDLSPDILRLIPDLAAQFPAAAVTGENP